MKTIQERAMDSKVWEERGVVGFIVRSTYIVWIPIMVIGCFFAGLIGWLWTGTFPERFKIDSTEQSTKTDNENDQ